MGKFGLEPGFEEQWRERFEEFALHRDDDAGIAGWTRSGLDARLRRFLGLWQPVPPDQRWLDAGCGAGTYSRALTSRGLDVVGVDYSAPTVAKAMTRGISGASFLISDVRRMPFPAGHFHGVLCFGVTQALDDSEPAIRELRRVLARDGQMWIDGLNRWCVVHLYERARRRMKGRQRHLRYESPRGVVRLCRKLGFTEVELHWLPVLPRRTQRMQRLLESKPVVWMFRRVPLVGLLASHSFIVRARRGRDLPANVDVRLQP